MENIINTVGYSKSPRCLGYRYLAYPLHIHRQYRPARQPDSPGTATGTDTDRGLHGPSASQPASQYDNQRGAEFRDQHYAVGQAVWYVYFTREDTPSGRHCATEHVSRFGRGCPLAAVSVQWIMNRQITRDKELYVIPAKAGIQVQVLPVLVYLIT